MQHPVRPTSRTCWRRSVARLLLPLLVWTVLVAGLLPTAQAQALPAAQPVDYPALALQWARRAAPLTLPESAAHLRLDISVGALDPRLSLAPCAQVDPYPPPGTRLWGRSRVGLRCVDGSVRWNVTVPVTVKAIGPAWVVRSQVMAGTPVAQSDVLQVDVDWAEDSSPVLQDSTAWLGHTATRNLSTGQVLRAGMVRATQVFQPGTQVRVVAQGPGFQVSGDAQALSAGVVGQSARVRMENGRVTSGTVLDARTVRIEL